MNRSVSGVAFGLIVSMLGIESVQSADLAIQKYPDVLDVRAQARADNRFDFDVTVSSPYDTPKRYADAFRVTGADGVHYGERILVHDHQSEQPFTRDLYGVNIPKSVRFVVVQARDQKYGYGGASLQVGLPGR